MKKCPNEWCRACNPPEMEYRPLKPLEKALMDAGLIEQSGGSGKQGEPMEPTWKFR